MCLVLPPSQKHRKIAQKDIECYKGYNISNIGMIVSPIRHMEVCPISEIKDRTVTAYGYEGVHVDEDDFTIVSSGFIHCCLKGVPPGDAVFKVIIPKGTEYYSNGVECCAKCIKIVDLVYCDLVIWRNQLRKLFSKPDPNNLFFRLKTTFKNVFNY